MNTNRAWSRVILFVLGVALVFQISPVMAGASSKQEGNRQRGTLAVSFTKWVIGNGPAMAGHAQGGRARFVGEVLDLRVSETLGIARIEAIYEIQAGRHSFTALIDGGQSLLTRRAVLDGVILHGWHAGARVHVEYLAKDSCPNPPAGATPECYVGTIYIDRASEK